jgi:hypothetical protein
LISCINLPLQVIRLSENNRSLLKKILQRRGYAND